MITKKCALTLGGFALTTFLFFISLHVTSLFKTSKWMGVGVAVGVFVIMLIFTLVYRKNAVLPFFVIPINAIADGLAASSLFTHIGVYPQIWQTAILFAAVNAAFMPATPAPTTATFRLAFAGSSWLTHASRPVAGLTEQTNSRWASTQW